MLQAIAPHQWVQHKVLPLSGLVVGAMISTKSWTKAPVAIGGSAKDVVDWDLKNLVLAPTPPEFVIPPALPGSKMKIVSKHATLESARQARSAADVPDDALLHIELHICNKKAHDDQRYLLIACIPPSGNE